MIKNRIRICVACILALILALTAPLAVLADIPDPNESQIHIDEGVVKVYDPDTDSFVPDDELTEKQVLDGDLKPTDPADYNGWIYPALDVDNEEANAAFTVNGSVEMDIDRSGAATAVQVETSYVETKFAVAGDATAKADAKTPNPETGEESAIAFAVVGRALPGATVDITVDGDAAAAADGHDGTGWSTAVYADASFNNASTTIHVKGDATAEAEAGKESENQDETLTHAVSACGENSGAVTITVDGKASASSEETNYVAQAVFSQATSDPDFDHEGTKAEVTVGKGAEGQIMALSDNEGTAKVTVLDGGVVSDSGRFGAVVGDADTGGSTTLSITGDIVSTDSELHPGNATGAAVSAADKGTATATITGNVTASADDSAEGKGIEALGLDTDSDGGTVNVQVNGDVGAAASSAGDGRADASGISALAFAEDGQPGSVTVEVSGDVKAEAHNTDGVAEALAITAAAKGAENGVNIHVQGDVTAVSASTEPDVTLQFGTRAVYADAHDGGIVELTVDGKAAADAPEALSMPRSVDAEADGEGSIVTVEIGKGAEGMITESSNHGALVTVVVKEGGVEAGIVGVDSAATNKAVAQVLVNGDIKVHETVVDPGESYGVSLSANEEAAVAAIVLGNVTATGSTGDAVGLATGSSGGGSVEVSIDGDVTASGAERNYGISIYSDKDSYTDIIVDGTVTGKDSAVVLVQPEAQIGENVTLTVWELVPNENGAVVSRAEDDQGRAPAEDEAAEKAVQYIIRVRADQQDIITAQGTTEYKEYHVAHEGDTVTMLLNIPEGYEITGAYGDVDQSVTLLKDENGNYYLTVPRGGAVELSVTLEKTDEDDAAGIVGGAVFRILEISDKTDKAHLSFYSNGRYVARYEDGTSEYGSFRLSDGALVLKNDNDASHTKMTAELNADKDLYELAFHPSADPETTYEFEIAAKDFKTLTALRYALRAF